jgi:NADPH-dependent curcumin reductase CurA
MPNNRQIHLVSRPDPILGPRAENFALRETPMPVPGPGQVLLQTLYLSLDPYMRARMYQGDNYAAATALDAPMVGNTVARVIETRHPDFYVGDVVESAHGWQAYVLSDGSGLTPIYADAAPLSAHLGVLGMPGQTGYTAMTRHGQPGPGQTVVISAASGPVGSVAGQTARIAGARVVGIAGGAEKCAYVTDELGFDACIDHRAHDFSVRLTAACPQGVDIYFDNVGGPVAVAVLPLLNAGARFLVCGTVAVDRDRPMSEPDLPSMQTLLSAALVKRLTIRGFVYSDPDLLALAPEFRANVGDWLQSGQLHAREQIIDGLEAAPEAFLGLFTGANFGKLIVRVHPE